MKYWSLARKIEDIKKNINPDRINKWYLAYLVLGAIANLVSGILWMKSVSLFPLKIVGIKTNETKITAVALVFMLPLFVSWFILSDAFRRFKNMKN